LGASLGPIFASCSPTYALIISSILPTSLAMGILSIMMYIIGFGLVIFIIIYFGKEALQYLRRYANPHGIFKKTI
jgi:cytochrome c biogenesis protein, transmembrane region